MRDLKVATSPSWIEEGNLAVGVTISQNDRKMRISKVGAQLRTCGHMAARPLLAVYIT